MVEWAFSSTRVFALSWPGGSWQDTVKFVSAGVITYLLALWLAGLIWVYRDICSRSRDPFFRAAAVFLILAFNLPGLWLYLILRPKRTLAEAYESSLEEEALLQDLEDQKGCPTCHRRVLDDYIVCPSCTTQLKEPCQQCGKPLSYSWTACPYCAYFRRGRGRSDATGEVSLAPAPTPAAMPGTNGATTRLDEAALPEHDPGWSTPSPVR